MLKIYKQPRLNNTNIRTVAQHVPLQASPYAAGDIAPLYQPAEAHYQMEQLQAELNAYGDVEVIEARCKQLDALYNPAVTGPRSFVATHAKQSFVLAVSGQESGQDLVRMIVDAGFADFEPSHIRLVWDGKDIADDDASDKTVDQLGIPANAEIDIHYRHTCEGSLVGGAGNDEAGPQS
jgi:hypothetical protein